jgi:hypothetical protein
MARDLFDDSLSETVDVGIGKGQIERDGDGRHVPGSLCKELDPGLRA